MLHKSKITVKVSFIHSPLIDLIESLSQKGDLPSTTDAETKLPAWCLYHGMPSRFRTVSLILSPDLTTTPPLAC